MNFTFFYELFVKFIVFAPVICVTRMLRSCHKRVMKITGAKTMIFSFFVQENL